MTDEEAAEDKPTGPGRPRTFADVRAEVRRWGLRFAELGVQVLRYRYATAALVLLAVLALYGVAALSRPSGEAAVGVGRRIPVSSAVLACPGTRDGRVSALAPVTSRGAGRADVSSMADGQTLASLTRPGLPWSRDVEDAPDAYMVKAQGAPAAGLAAERTTYVGKGDDRGLAATRCAAPGNDLRFIGPGPLDADRIDVYLTNLDAQPATVDITALSGEGPLDTADGRGILVGPHGTRIVRLGDTPDGMGEIVTTSQLLALRVRTTTGRVAAAVRVRVAEEKGVDWLPVAGAPAATLTVPGIPSGPGGRRLLVAVPGQDDARVMIQVMTPTGAFAPEGRDTMDVPAGTVMPLDLEHALGGKAAAVLLVANRPIVAGFAAERGDDVAYGVATHPLTRAGGVVADNRFNSSLLLTAPGNAATVRVTTIGAQGTPGRPQDVRIAAGRTIEVEPTPPPGDADEGFGLLVVPLPGSGPVHAARVMATGRDDRLFTVLPIAPAVTTLDLPPVVDSPRVLLPVERRPG
ncbi:DUF5719 family protein [Thermomonospora umbrina]|uniref:Uncharacterized protein n=1 Tax=Thermomonospora umbrina TaxID=111806 RepID=A0A3D9SRJ7_9ACTN|nr:DUF5719 family protein [Thermomonospora umbrina]REE98438.1 hypothetical protein DFJ69_3927 [Thermomonospora umbrina]